MKSLLILPLVVAFSLASRAGEYVTLNNNKKSVAVNPSDIVQVVSVLVSGGTSDNLRFDLAEATETAPLLYIGQPGTAGTAVAPNLTMTGLSQVRLEFGNKGHVVTLRISKPNEGFTSEPLVVPVAQGTSYSVVLETSTDMQMWVPANPGDYAATGTARFFRVKAAVNPGAP